jgi:hypothetical protein
MKWMASVGLIIDPLLEFATNCLLKNLKYSV